MRLEGSTGASAPRIYMTRALVLTAGHGTRLQPLTGVRAKPAIPVAGEPIVRRIIRWLAANGVTDLVLNLHHRPETLTRLVGDGSDLAVSVRYSWEHPIVLGSAGGPRQALPLIGADDFFLINGDTLTDLPLAPLEAAHAASGALVTLALVPNREPLNYGGVRLDARGAVTGFVPHGPAAEDSYHFIGVQAVAAEAFQSVPPGQARNSVGGLYEELIAARPGSVRGFISEAHFWDIGTVSDYLHTDEAFRTASGNAECPGHEYSEGPYPPDAPAGRWATARRARIDPSACLTRCIVWDDVEIGAGCRLDCCILTDGVRIPAGSSHEHAILLTRSDGEILSVPL